MPYENDVMAIDQNTFEALDVAACWSALNLCHIIEHHVEKSIETSKLAGIFSVVLHDDP